MPAFMRLFNNASAISKMWIRFLVLQFRRLYFRISCFLPLVHLNFMHRLYRLYLRWRKENLHRFHFVIVTQTKKPLLYTLGAIFFLNEMYYSSALRVDNSQLKLYICPHSFYTFQHLAPSLRNPIPS